ncbi:LacI family transcriptional regulator [Pandoraea cepalis]|uniref:LacI family transcriptional regulator n=1 Tax=Pandoraea cepalis TaxID=2508294 RepID=A0A5E4WZT4_9BURK|nr:tripartite tricarboxylate transporter substrate binding protein [Pandoraea cepalis]VVE29545.1 LacI family transcriptional regulator [Pandoraea cepalis]
MDKRHFGRTLGALVLSGLALRQKAFASSQNRASLPRTITLTVPFLPGGGADQVARDFVQATAAVLADSSIVVLNRPGANGLVAERLISQERNDGSALLLGTSSTLAIGPMLVRSDLNPIDDLSPITLLSKSANVLAVRAESKISTLASFIEEARKSPLSCGTFGVGSSGSLYSSMLQSEAGVHITQIAYKGSGQAISDLLGNHVQSVFVTTSAIAALVRAGKIRPLAVTGSARTTIFPGIPTFEESGIKGLDLNGWFGIFGPKGVPSEIATIFSEVARSLNENPAFLKRMSANGFDWVGSSPDQMGSELKRTISQAKRMVKVANIEIQ